MREQHICCLIAEICDEAMKERAILGGIEKRLLEVVGKAARSLQEKYEQQEADETERIKELMARCSE